MTPAPLSPAKTAAATATAATKDAATAPALPLLARAAAEVFAWRADGPVSVGRFVAEARQLSARLPAGDWLLNVCQDRYRFALVFAAGLLAGKTSLQPSSLSRATLQQLAADYPATFCVGDGDFDAGGLPAVAFAELQTEADAENGATTDSASESNFDADAGATIDMPMIAADRVAAILFTSGSTGRPQPHAKTWGKLVANARAGAAGLGLDTHPHAIVGTVPIQHSYGFESTFLLALHAHCPVWSGKPFFPEDIAAALAAVPRPRLLVTTPFHLAALLAADIALPPVDLLLSATAPLADALAAQAEARCAAPVHEIYGSTETGQIATRRTVAGPVWRLLPSIVLDDGNDSDEGEGDETYDSGDRTYASGGHIEKRVALGDIIERLPGGDTFLLQGRHADLINLAGKRTSLAYLNHQIAAVPGVIDAAFYLPETVGGADRADAATATKAANASAADAATDNFARLAAFVVAPTLTRRELIAALRERIDPIFLPRPLVFVDALPRNSTGKLPKGELQALYAARVKEGGND